MYIYSYNFIYIYIYTRKPGRSPTKHSVSKPDFTSVVSLEFLECSRSLSFLWFKPIQGIRLQHMFFWNKPHGTLWTRTLSQVWACVKACTEGVHCVPPFHPPTPRCVDGLMVYIKVSEKSKISLKHHGHLCSVLQLPHITTYISFLS